MSTRRPVADDPVMPVPFLSEDHPATPSRAILLVTAGLLALVTAASWWLRDRLVDTVATWTVDLPGRVREALEPIGDGGVVVLASLCLVLGWRAWYRSRAAGATAVVAAAATALAYAASEGIKVLVAQARPCHRVAELAVECPSAADYSWPSNHATVAGALVAAVVLLAPARRWPVVAAFLVAGAVVVARVLGGVHYVHDVSAGLLLGGVLVLVAGRSLTPHLGARL